MWYKETKYLLAGTDCLSLCIDSLWGENAPQILPDNQCINRAQNGLKQLLGKINIQKQLKNLVQV